MAKSSIEWTQATWNPIVGCSIVSPGCTNCYAMKMAARIEGMNAEARECSHRKPTAPHYDGTTRKVNGNAVWTGKLARAPNSTWLAPLQRRRPTTYFVNSMGDLFHEDCPDEWILDALTVVAIAHQHTFQVLTKRADRMREFMSRPDLLEDIYANWYSWDSGAREVQSWPLHNLWLGASAEDQRRFDDRQYDLRETPAKVRFFSFEPLLSEIDTRGELCGGDFHWAIVGGESGPGARPMQPDWARSLRDQCAAAGVPFFFKQWGEWADADDYPSEMQEHLELINRADGNSVRVGKKRAGRLLDGALHDAMPQVHSQIT
jgi:protein gp37